MINRICTHRDIPLRERVLWRMLYESASRAAAVLALNVEDCDFDNRRAKVTVKGGDIGWVVWGSGTALLLSRYLKGASPARCSVPTVGPAQGAERQPPAETSARRPTGCSWGTTAPAP